MKCSNIFDQDNFPLFSILPGGLIIELSISTLTRVIQKCVHNLVFRIAVSYWKWQSLCILKPLNVIDRLFPSFMCNLLESPIISTFICKGHIFPMWLQFFHTFHSIFWELSNQYSAMYITISMQKVYDGLFWIILNSLDMIFSQCRKTCEVLLDYQKNRRGWCYWGLCKKGYQKPFAF